MAKKPLPLDQVYCDPWHLLHAVCEAVAWPGTKLARVRPEVDFYLERVGFRLTRLGDRVERHLVDRKRLCEHKPGGMPENLWAAFRSNDGLRRIAREIGRGTPRDKLGPALPSPAACNPERDARLVLPE